jgi:hypothetical protein
VVDRAIGIVVAAVLIGGCNQATAPDPVATGSIKNLQVRQLGLTHNVCNWAWDYAVHDEVTFETHRLSAAALVGASAIQLVGTERIALGTIGNCPETTTPCTAQTTVCVTQSSQAGGTIRIYRRLEWSPQYQWNILVNMDGEDTNVLSLVVNRPEGLPFGDWAAIAHIDAGKNLPYYSYVIVAYSPGVLGRRIRITREIWSNGIRFSQLTFERPETSARLVVSTGPSNWPPGPAEFIGIMEEIDANGVVIVTDRKSIFVN